MIENSHVLTLNARYFFLRKPLERRLYELDRKHCGQQPEWKIGLEKLREKCGSGSSGREFKRLVSKIPEDDARHDHMPDYSFTLEDEIVTVRPKQNLVQTPQSLLSSGLRIAPETHEKARQAAAGWDVHGLEVDWRSWAPGKDIIVRDPDAHFSSLMTPDAQGRKRWYAILASALRCTGQRGRTYLPPVMSDE